MLAVADPWQIWEGAAFRRADEGREDPRSDRERRGGRKGLISGPDTLQTAPARPVLAVRGAGWARRGGREIWRRWLQSAVEWYAVGPAPRRTNGFATSPGPRAGTVQTSNVHQSTAAIDETARGGRGASWADTDCHSLAVSPVTSRAREGCGRAEGNIGRWAVVVVVVVLRAN